MKQILNNEELSGKTIERAQLLDSKKYFLFFTDKTFCVFDARGYEDPEIELDEEGFDLTPKEYNYYDLEVLGLISNEECRALELKYQNERDESRKRQEIDELKKLQQKYPDVK